LATENDDDFNIKEIEKQAIGNDFKALQKKQ
jgi:hypothetical protein